MLPQNPAKSQNRNVTHGSEKFQTVRLVRLPGGDLRAARVQSFNVFDHGTSVRFQANFYNALQQNQPGPSNNATAETLSSASHPQPTPDG